jgi:hypothetical protein
MGSRRIWVASSLLVLLVTASGHSARAGSGLRPRLPGRGHAEEAKSGSDGPREDLSALTATVRGEREKVERERADAAKAEKDRAKAERQKTKQEARARKQALKAESAKDLETYRNLLTTIVQDEQLRTLIEEVNGQQGHSQREGIVLGERNQVKMVLTGRGVELQAYLLLPGGRSETRLVRAGTIRFTKRDLARAALRGSLHNTLGLHRVLGTIGDGYFGTPEEIRQKYEAGRRAFIAKAQGIAKSTSTAEAGRGE